MAYVDEARWNYFWDKATATLGIEKPEYPTRRAETPSPEGVQNIGGFVLREELPPEN